MTTPTTALSNHPLRGLNAREVLRAINDWAREATHSDANDLWDVLTALRGPDSQSFSLKQITTVAVRENTVPALAEKVGADAYVPIEATLRVPAIKILRFYAAPPKES